VQGEEEGDVILPLVVHETSIFALTYTSNGDLWTASADRTTKQLARQRGFAVDTTLTSNDYVKAVVVAEQAQGVVVTCSRDEDVRVWDATSGRCLARLQGHWDEVTGLALVENGKAVVSVSIDGTVRKWGLGEADFKRALELFEQGGKKEETEKKSLLTEDEERELAELMDDDDD
jgi:WD40 repeat protein